MKKTKYSRLWVVLLALVFISGAICLRVNKHIESSDFSILVVSILVGTFVIIFFEKISEISIIGNTVKLEQINEKSEELLKQLRIEHFKLRIDSAFSPTNFFSSGDSVSTCRAKLYEVAKDIKEAGLLDNDELKNKIQPLLIDHTGYHLKFIRDFGSSVENNPLIELIDPDDFEKAITDEILRSVRIPDAHSNVDKLRAILDNIEIYRNLFKAKKWFD
ncbi:hypothetical protein M5F04_04365 [Acinetobacter sp. ANC 7200]|uniref:hypothetical protein n=1 Tax=Acinetobacter amyesii TaxID=2942470 RepID=UPI0020BF6999|nr:hypothetical protein [Acinetobacter amyesii]MCL6243806.1 hypothetical protein [Acinetobacter amyesii]